MAVAFVKNVATNSSTSTTTNVLTVPAGGVAAGNVLILRGCGDHTTASVVDTGGNTYTLLEDLNGTFAPSIIWVANMTTALVSTNTITITWDSKSSRGASADEFSGLGFTEDGTSATASATSATPSASMTPANVGLVVSNMLIKSGNPDGFTEDSDTVNGSWVSFTAVTNNSVDIMRGAYKILTASGAQTYNPTPAISRDWGLAVAAVNPPVAAYVRPAVFVSTSAVQRAANW